MRGRETVTVTEAVTVTESVACGGYGCLPARPTGRPEAAEGCGPMPDARDRGRDRWPWP